MNAATPSKQFRPTDVFTPGSKPTVTYYDRSELNLEFRLLEAIETKGLITSVSGPSKSGKTVLCENVIGKRKMFLVPGGGIKTIDGFWDRIREKLGLPSQVSSTTGASTTEALATEAKGGLSLPLVYELKGGVTGTLTDGTSSSTQSGYVGVQGFKLLSMLSELGFTLVVDDFHYILAEVRIQLAQFFKEAARDGLPIVVVAVSHRADDAIRANPELRGRVVILDIPQWGSAELRKIAELGFPKLGIEVTERSLGRLETESLGSPQLMQALCLKLCKQMGWSEGFVSSKPVEISDPNMGLLFKDTSTLTDCRTAFELLATGPRTRGEERKEFTFKDGTRGDVYITILKALATGVPQLTISYDTIKQRIDEICIGDRPRGIGIDRALEKMKAITDEKLKGDQVFDWNENHVNLPDPYFLYYLRWAEWPDVN